MTTCGVLCAIRALGLTKRSFYDIINVYMENDNHKRLPVVDCEHGSFTIRPPRKRDADVLSRYINEISEEKTFTLLQGEHTTISETVNYIERVKKGIRNKKEVYLLVFHKGELIGVGEVRILQKIYEHIGNVSITIKKEFRGRGLGNLLMKKLITEVLQFTEVRKLVLQVFKNNIPAIHLYKKMGFKEYGRLPKAIKWKGVYVDEILMYKDIR